MNNITILVHTTIGLSIIITVTQVLDLICCFRGEGYSTLNPF